MEIPKFCPLCGAYCHGETCAMWQYTKCGLIHTGPDLYDIVKSVNHLTEAVQHVDKTIDRLQL